MPIMPWLVGTALVHSAIVTEKRNALKVWTILLAIMAFWLSLLGTFLVRSGVLTSVHTFATDPTRGLFILLLLAAFHRRRLSLFAIGPRRWSRGLFAPVSREGALILNNLFSPRTRRRACRHALPPGARCAHRHVISVGAPFFNLTFGPLMAPLMIVCRSARSSPGSAAICWAAAALVAAGAAALVIALIVILVWNGAALYPYAFASYDYICDLRYRLARWWSFLSGSAYSARRLAKRSARMSGLPRASFGTLLAHAGIGISLLGIVCGGWLEC